MQCIIRKMSDANKTNETHMQKKAAVDALVMGITAAMCDGGFDREQKVEALRRCVVEAECSVDDRSAMLAQVRRMQNDVEDRKRTCEDMADAVRRMESLQLLCKSRKEEGRKKIEQDKIRTLAETEKKREELTRIEADTSDLARAVSNTVKESRVLRERVKQEKEVQERCRKAFTNLERKVRDRAEREEQVLFDLSVRVKKARTAAQDAKQELSVVNHAMFETICDLAESRGVKVALDRRAGRLITTPAL